MAILAGLPMLMVGFPGKKPIWLKSSNQLFDITVIMTLKDYLGEKSERRF